MIDSTALCTFSLLNRLSMYSRPVHRVSVSSTTPIWVIWNILRSMLISGGMSALGQLLVFQKVVERASCKA